MWFANNNSNQLQAKVNNWISKHNSKVNKKKELN